MPCIHLLALLVNTSRKLLGSSSSLNNL
jgi:hypothetical protein